MTKKFPTPITTWTKQKVGDPHLFKEPEDLRAKIMISDIRTRAKTA